MLSPQVRDRNKIWYEIEDQKITATINDVSDAFDFTGMPDGELQLWDDEGNDLIEAELDEVPILSAEKKDGVLTVEILFSIDSNEQDERLLFPEPMTLDEFNNLMDELAERDKPDDGVEEDSGDSLEETDDLAEPDEVADDDIIVEDERIDGEELVYKDDYIIDLEEVDF